MAVARLGGFTNEAALAAVVVAWLRDLGWCVYQEVSAGSGVADIVATRGPLLWAIETKTTLGVSVLKQAHRWQHSANLVSVAVPLSRGTFAEHLAGLLGVGVLRVSSEDSQWSPRVRESVAAKLRRRTFDLLRRRLRAEQMSYAPAGNAAGLRWSPFKNTCSEVARFVAAHPGCSLKDLVDRVDTHYSCKAVARGSIVHWIDAGAIPGVRVDREGRRLRLFPVGAA